MASLDDVWKTVFPAARAVSPLDAAAAAREVAWVHVLKARVPAFDALDPDDLAVVPAAALAVVAGAPGDVERLVADFGRARVAALLILEAGAPNAAAAAESLAEGAAATGLPAFRLAGSDPFALERSIIGFLVNRRAELDHQAGRLEAILEHVALTGGGLERIVASIATFLGRAVALEGRRGTALAIHAPADTAGAGGAVAAYLAQPRQVALRVPLPGVPAAGGDAAASLPSIARGAALPPSGSIALLGEGPPSELERVATRRVAGFLALELARDTAIRRYRDAARQAEPLPEDGPPWVVLVARQSDAAATPLGPARPAVQGGAEPETLEHREATRREVRLLATPRRLALRGDAESLELRAVLATDEEDPFGLALSARIAALLGRSVAVSRPFDEPAARPLSEAEARSTLEAVERLPDPPLVARADRLAAYRLLASMRAMPDGVEAARALLGPILVGSPVAQRERLATLRAVLEFPGLAEAAAALGLHRNTVAYRVRRIEELTGWELADPDLRLPLAVAARLVQIAQ